jgi:hypothetical protein
MKKKGAALLVVIIIMMLTFLLAGIIFETSIKHLRVSSDTVESTKAYYCAETGIYDAINYIELMAESGSLNSSYFGRNIPIFNLYSKGDHAEGANLYLFGDTAAFYIASIELVDPIVNDVKEVIVDNKVVMVSTPLIEKIYNCKINSKGTYNNQNYLINDTVTIYYNSDSWTYSFTSKLSTKD